MSDTPRTDAVRNTPIMGETVTEHKWDAMTELARALERELATALKLANDNLFRPIGDNHHNALLCPYCNPDRGIQKAKEEAEREVQNALEMLKSAQCPVGCSDGMIINGGPDPVYEQCEWCYGRQMLIDAALDAARKEVEL